jgi:hypothetical protein
MLDKMVSRLAFRASTTNYDGDEGSCGGCKINLVHGVAGWAAAATPQSMQVTIYDVTKLDPGPLIQNFS